MSTATLCHTYIAYAHSGVKRKCQMLPYETMKFVVIGLCDCDPKPEKLCQQFGIFPKLLGDTVRVLDASFDVPFVVWFGAIRG
ncbi:hypothetical protein E4T56_gene20782 [Termitomyces sp. T112]|nr:hypothetical protein E4T56_gene20782 [Termitomyces sp. T112]